MCSQSHTHISYMNQRVKISLFFASTLPIRRYILANIPSVHLYIGSINILIYLLDKVIFITGNYLLHVFIESWVKVMHTFKRKWISKLFWKYHTKAPKKHILLSRNWRFMTKVWSKVIFRYLSCHINMVQRFRGINRAFSRFCLTWK